MRATLIMLTALLAGCRVVYEGVLPDGLTVEYAGESCTVLYESEDAE